MTDWILPPSPFVSDPAPPEPAPPRAPPPRKPKRPRKPGGGRGWAIAISVLVVLVLLAGGMGALTVKRFIDETPQIPDRAALLVAVQAPGMTFEDRTGQVIATRGAKHGYPITLDTLPSYVPQAFLAAEDRRFYHHGPIDLRGIARAFWVNWRAHHTVQGGSTLTQQLAKTLFLTPPADDAPQAAGSGDRLAAGKGDEQGSVA